jgi:hypothetical protein
VARGGDRIVTASEPGNGQLAPAGKIFGIGLSRTGTTSLHRALEILGYRSVHYPPPDSIDALLEDHDALSDTPVACRFRELDCRYPNSRFILTVRDFRSWLTSTRRFFAGPPPEQAWRREVRLETYGRLDWDRRAFLHAYHRHIETVTEYFATRPEALLILDVVAGEGWEPLCDFLEKPVPALPFPHEYPAAVAR